MKDTLGALIDYEVRTLTLSLVETTGMSPLDAERLAYSILLPSTEEDG
jgi:hypothetical protein